MNLLLLILVSLTCCSFDRSGVPSSDMAAPAGDGSWLDVALVLDGPPLVDVGGPVDGSIDAGPDAHDLSETAPPDSLAPDSLVPDSLVPPLCVPSQCPLGCHPTQPRCARLKPFNFDPSGFYDVATAGLTLTGQVTIDGTSGSISGHRAAGNSKTAPGGIYWDVMTQSGGLQLAVFAVDILVVSPGAVVTVAGGHPVALYVRQAVTISGKINARAILAEPGPGGRAGGVKNGAAGVACAGGQGQGGQASGQYQAGGGGGGRGQNGAKGGNSGGLQGGAGGQAISLSSSVLEGGCGGGAGGGPDPYGDGPNGGDGGNGGGGGGALQLVAGAGITITAGGINAGGGGGTGGHYGAGGGGGGSGGTIVLEAPTVTASGGVLAANGGSGAAGGIDWPVQNAPNGKNGSLSTQPALGASGSGSFSGAGGDGGALSSSPTPAPNFHNAGGGGGGAGRIRINANSATVTTSPTHTVGKPQTW